jgi:hypothetical protein
MIAEEVDARIREALDAVLGRPSLSLEEAAQRRGQAVDGILEALGEFDARDLAAGERDLLEALSADLPGVDAAALHFAVDEVMVEQARASEVARQRVAENLRAAVAAPAERRESQVHRVLAAERGRLEQRRAARLSRAISLLDGLAGAGWAA